MKQTVKSVAESGNVALVPFKKKIGVYFFLVFGITRLFFQSLDIKSEQHRWHFSRLPPSFPSSWCCLVVGAL